MCRRHASVMHMHCRCIAVCAFVQCTTAAVRRVLVGAPVAPSSLCCCPLLGADVLRPGEFLVGALLVVAPVDQGEELPDRRPYVLRPWLALGPSDGSKLAFVGWKRSVAPVVHQQQKVSTVLGAIKVHGVSQVIPDKQRHPCVRTAHANASLIRAAVAARSRSVRIICSTRRTAWATVL